MALTLAPTSLCGIRMLPYSGDAKGVILGSKKEKPTNSCQYTHPVQQFHFPDVLRRHASSGRWLSVDGDNVVLHMSNKSCWEAPGFAN